MNVRLISLTILLASIALIIISLLTWFVFGGEKLARETILDKLRPQIGSSLKAEYLSFKYNSITFNNVELQASPTLSLKFDRIHVKVFPITILFGGINKPDEIKEIELIEPQINILPAKVDRSGNGTASYKPFPLKSLSKLNVVRRVNIVNARISVGHKRYVLIDSLIGRIDLADISNVDMSLEGQLRKLPDARLEIKGAADFTEGSFLAGGQLIVNDLAAWTPPQEWEELKLHKGSVVVSFDLRGTDDLRLTGRLEADSIAAVYRDKLYLTDGSLYGELFGSSLELEGVLNLNGIPLPFNANVSDLLVPAWQLKIDNIPFDLEQLEYNGKGLLSLKGDVKLSALLYGESDYWWGDVQLQGQSISIDNVLFNNFAINAVADSNRIMIDNLTAEVLDGDFDLDGLIELSGGASEINFDYKRKWDDEKSLDFLIPEEPELKIRGNLAYKEDVLMGNGICKLTDVNEITHIAGQFNLIDSEFQMNLTSPIRDGSLSLIVQNLNDSPSFKFKGRNPQQLFNDVLTGKYLPAFLQDYNIKLDADGIKDRCNIQLTGKSASGERRVSCRCVLNKRENTYKSTVDLRLDIQNTRSFVGGFTGEYSNGNVIVRKARLVDENGRLLLETHFDINPKDFYVQNISFNTDSLPVIELLQFAKSDVASGFTGFLDADIKGGEDTLKWQSKLLLTSPDSLILKMDSEGLYKAGRCSVIDLSLQDIYEDKEIFTFNGMVDVKRRIIDSLVMRAIDLPIERLLQLVYPNIANRFGGRINARIEADGSLNYPMLNVKFHTTNGVLHSIPDYWMNLDLSTKDSLYILNKLDFGRGITGLVNVDGSMNRYNRTFSFDLEGSDVDIANLMEALTGKAGPLSGNSDFRMKFIRCQSIGIDSSSDKSVASTIAITGCQPVAVDSVLESKLDVNISVSPGKIGLLSFDNLSSQLNITDLESGKPVLNLDSAWIDWGDVSGGFSGSVDMTKDGLLDITGLVEGRLLGLLPRLTHFFSQPMGDGELSFHLGGNVSNPQLTEGYFKLTDGSIRLNKVIKKLDKINAHFELDSYGRIHIRKLYGLGNRQPFIFSNRLPEEGEEGITVIGYKFGIIQFQTGKEGIWMEIPSLMQPDWGGYFRFDGLDRKGPFEFHGPAKRPLGIGEIRLMNATFTYPFLKGKKNPSPFVRSLLELLERMRWDGRVIPFQACKYSREISGFGELPGLAELEDDVMGGLLDLDVKMYVDLRIDDDLEGLHFTGSLLDTLHINGELTSTNGRLEYLDLSFDVDKTGIIFNPVELEPVFYGGLRTDVIDTSGIPREIRWVIRKSNRLERYLPDMVDSKSESEQSLTQDHCRWNEISLVFEDDQGHSQEQILALLGYSPEALPDKLVELGGRLMTNATPLRRWTRMFERQAEKWLGVDRVVIESPVAYNIIERQLYAGDRLPEDNPAKYSYLQTLDHSKWTVGKYLSRDVYLSYTGSLLSSTNAYDITRIGVIHNWDILIKLYQIAPNLILDYRYEYDSLLREDDNRIFFRFSYTFK
ncbi:MAG: hypothetical protein P9X24_06495 [Candidatus Hatepunaea meridiana]|nr:hypothetical protein [Candidatus Hatepunaea meridiana]